MDRSEGDFSVFVSNTLDTIGYSSSMRKYRREQLSCRFDMSSRKFSTDTDSYLILAGSKGEGISRLRESDVDTMIVTNIAICVEDITQYNATNDEQLLLQMDRRHTAPGYTRLSPLEDLPECIVSNEGIDCLPNDIFIKANRDFHDLISSRQGPAWCVIYDGVPGDLVMAYRCQCPSIMTTWLRRQRRHDWPSRQILRDMCVLEAHVVPVGFKRSYEQDLEWRICFTRAELGLVRSLNDTQIKVFILLKFLAKSVLKPVCGGMTSYVMKNIILWLSELSQQSMFKTERLIDCLVRSLRLLSIFIGRGVLPSYMIPQRNLLSGNLRPGEKKSLLSVLSDLMNEGGSMLLRCDKMKEAMLKMYKTPDAAIRDGEKKDKFEKLIILYEYLTFKNVDVNENLKEDLSEQVEYYRQQIIEHEDDSISLNIRQQIDEIVMPDELSLRRRGKIVQNVKMKRFDKLLSQLT